MYFECALVKKIVPLSWLKGKIGVGSKERDESWQERKMQRRIERRQRERERENIKKELL